jgi:hypothetical protein
MKKEAIIPLGDRFYHEPCGTLMAVVNDAHPPDYEVQLCCPACQVETTHVPARLLCDFQPYRSRPPVWIMPELAVELACVTDDQLIEAMQDGRLRTDRNGFIDRNELFVQFRRRTECPSCFGTGSRA